MSSHSVAQWLRQLLTVQDAEPVAIQIGRTVYRGARYTAIGRYSKGTRAVDSGAHQDGETYTEERYYLVGKLPASARRPIAYRFNGDTRDWYIGGYYQHTPVKPEHAEFHPFGVHFLLHAWQVPDGTAIDAYDRTPRRRMAAKLIG